MLNLLEGGEMASDELFSHASAQGISERTLKIAKQNLGVTAIRRGGRWYSHLPETAQEGKGVKHS